MIAVMSNELTYKYWPRCWTSRTLGKYPSQVFMEPGFNGSVGEVHCFCRGQKEAAIWPKPLLLLLIYLSTSFFTCLQFLQLLSNFNRTTGLCVLSQTPDTDRKKLSMVLNNESERNCFDECQSLFTRKIKWNIH